MAFTVVEPDLSYRDLTLGELADLSASFAAGLADLGVGPGDAVATLMGRSADLVVALALRASDDQPAGYRLRRASSAGEPLTPDIVTWSKATLGTEVVISTVKPSMAC